VPVKRPFLILSTFPIPKGLNVYRNKFPLKCDSDGVEYVFIRTRY
jgi:hypothetical protein